jgi:hypothetical protein
LRRIIFSKYCSVKGKIGGTEPSKRFAEIIILGYKKCSKRNLLEWG